MPKCDFRGVIENSPFVERSLKSMYPGTDEAELPARLEALAQMSPSAEEIRSEIRETEDEEALALRMREVRRRILVTLAARDATGLGGYPEVVRVMTELAEETIQELSAVRPGCSRNGSVFRCQRTACRRICSSWVWVSWAARNLTCPLISI